MPDQVHFSFGNAGILQPGDLNSFQREAQGLDFDPVTSENIPPEVRLLLDGMLFFGMINGKVTLIYFGTEMVEGSGAVVIAMRVPEAATEEFGARARYAAEVRAFFPSLGGRLPSEIGSDPARTTKLFIALVRWVRGDIEGEIA